MTSSSDTTAADRGKTTTRQRRARGRSPSRTSTISEKGDNERAEPIDEDEQQAIIHDLTMEINKQQKQYEYLLKVICMFFILSSIVLIPLVHYVLNESPLVREELTKETPTNDSLSLLLRHGLLATIIHLYTLYYCVPANSSSFADGTTSSIPLRQMFILFASIVLIMFCMCYLLGQLDDYIMNVNKLLNSNSQIIPTSNYKLDEAQDILYGEVLHMVISFGYIFVFVFCFIIKYDALDSQKQLYALQNSKYKHKTL